MKTIIKNRILFAFGMFGFSLFAVMCLTGSQAFAAARTWDGGGSDENFSTATNWSDDTVPVNGDSINLPQDVIFAGCSGAGSDIVLNNDLETSSTTLVGMNVTGTKPTECSVQLVIDGNDIKISGNITLPSDSLYGLEITSNIVLGGDSTVGAVYLNGDINTGSHTATFKGTNFLQETSTIVGENKIILNYSDMGLFGTCGSYSYPFWGDGSGFTGEIELTSESALLISSSANSLGRSASLITVKDSSILGISTGFNQDSTFATPINFASGTPNLTVQQESNLDSCDDPTQTKNLTLNGDIEFGVDTKVYLVNSNLKLMGNIIGKEKIKLQSGQTGQIIFSDGSSVASELNTVTISDQADCDKINYLYTSNNKVVVNIDCKTYNGNVQYPLNIKGILAGTGNAGHIKILSGGVIAPGMSPGTLTVGNIEWVEGGTYEFEIGKDSADQIKAIGSVNLGNGTLKVSLYDGAKPTKGKSYIIIDNDGTDKITGIFKGLPEGATFSDANNGVYKISYTGGDGNDVVLTVQQAPGVPNTGFELLQNNPILTLAITTVSAVAILLVAKKMKMTN